MLAFGWSWYKIFRKWLVLIIDINPLGGYAPSCVYVNYSYKPFSKYNMYQCAYSKGNCLGKKMLLEHICELWQRIQYVYINMEWKTPAQLNCAWKKFYNLKAWSIKRAMKAYKIAYLLTQQKQYEPWGRKTRLRGLWQGQTQTSLLS